MKLEQAKERVKQKKLLTKNEFRMDLNPAHYGIKKEPHPAYISARRGHMYRANIITHAKHTTDGQETHEIRENPNKKSQDRRPTRISSPYWQNEKKFSKEKLLNFRFSNSTRKKIKKYNRKK